VAQLTAHAQANPSDGSGFDYVLRATRRPTPPPTPPTTTPPPSSTPAFVQTTAGRQDTRTRNSVQFGLPTTTGNLIVAYVVWSNAGDVTVTDSSHNTYTSVPGGVPGGRVPWSTGFSAQVFYATNVADGTDIVTATFATPLLTNSDFGLLYIAEYSGIDK